MRRLQHTKLLCSLAGLLMFSALARQDARADAKRVSIAVIAGKDFAVHDVSVGLLRRAFGGETTEAGGKHVIPFNFAPGDAVRRSFDALVLQMAPDEIGRFWVDRRIRGQGDAPRTVPSAQVMKAVVAKLPGAIGYIAADQVDATVQVLTIDGKAIDDVGYPLLVP